MEDVTKGSKFGQWTIIQSNYDGTHLCECVCGNKKRIPEAWLVSGFSKSCGCRKSRAKDLRNVKFGFLTAIEPTGEKCTDKSIKWRCICDCGNETVVSSNHLLQNHTISCGCRARVAAKEGKTFIEGTCIEFLFSSKLRVNNTSGHTGVYKKRGKWNAYITVNKRKYSLGSHDSYDEAVKARKNAEEFWRKKLLEND